MPAAKKQFKDDVSLFQRAILKFDINTVAFMLEPWEKALFCMFLQILDQ